jgi:predicted acylesterase/phospholipase RssA
LGSCAALQACATAPLRPFVPAAVAPQAVVPDMQRIRIWGDAGPRDVRDYLAAEVGLLRQRRRMSPQSDILAISGGADDGAFSAGLLVGWGERGDRPMFDAVTGVSAGALVAPFAFLGAAYDRQLATVFTTHSAGEIYRANPLAAAFGGASLADNTPLADLIASYVDRAMLRAVAKARAQGRFLFVATTNLHAERPVFWDLGRIAAYDNATALKLFRDLLLASAAVPGVFPPVQIEVAVGAERFAELHVDGGPTREVFLAPLGLSFRDLDAAVGTAPRRRLWVVRNGKLAPEYDPVALKASSIAVRSLATLTKYQGLGDLARIYARARADGMDFNLASIPMSFSAPRAQPFDAAYMTALYAEGISRGRAGDAWAKAPPRG